MPGPPHPPRSAPSPWLGGLCVLLATALCSLALQSILQSGPLSSRFLSGGLWSRVVGLLGGHVVFHPQTGMIEADPGYARIFAINLGSGLICWLAGGWLISLRLEESYSKALGRWGLCGWLWGLIPAVWEAGRIFAPLLGDANSFDTFLVETSPLWMATAFAGWLATFGSLMTKPVSDASLSEKPKHSRAAFWGVVIAAVIYVIVFTAMNWQLYRNLLVPHGDSAMYEEHLWNLTHGKGFRSYQEDRLFLGEHLQVVHILLLPIYLIWPSLTTLDLCESLALASGAFPVFWITRRHTHSDRAGLCVAIAYLLYYPLQYLDIAIDLKTFRPIAFGVPLILYGLDQLERGRIKSSLVFWLVALSAKEDYAIILVPLGLWIAIFQPSYIKRNINLDHQAKPSRWRWYGIGLAAFSTVYLVLAVKYIIPWFRRGEEVHYVGYFQQFGSTLGEVVRNILGNPRLLFSELFAVTTPIYTASLLLPLGAMAILSPSRLLVALPLFGILCLNQIDRTPQHHFHAPLVPIMLWATAAGVARFPQILRLLKRRDANPIIDRDIYRTRWAAWFVLTSALCTGLFYSMSPLGIGFWDPDSNMYWKKRYIISERAKKFALVIDEIPKTARVFSTDFVHPRFTHYAKSYDYSSYRRATDKELTHPVPGETYYLVIDTGHPYSTIKKPADIPEYRNHPEDWELLPDRTDGYFIVLKRRPAKTD